MDGQDEILSQKLKLKQIIWNDWFQHSLFSYNWWIILACTIVAWYCLFRYINRRNIIETLLYGSFVTLLALVMDIIGVNLVLWDYPKRFDPFAPPLLPIDLVLLPIPYIFIYQTCTTWKSFIVLHVLFAIVLAFVIEPLLVKIHSYELYKWNHLYSFFIYLVIALFLRWIVKKIVHVQITARS